MTKQTEALKLALEALENHPGNYKLSKAECAEYGAVEDALREALALVNEVDQEPPPQQQGDPSTVAFCHVGDVVVCDNDSLLRQLGVKRSDKLYLHPQDLNCKSKQALLATLWGYTKEQPKRPPLTDNQIDKIAESMPGGLEGFLKGWGWRQFARAVLENDHNIK